MMTVTKQSYLFCHMPLYIHPSKNMVIFINGAATEGATESAPLAHLAHERERERGAILWHGDHRIQCWLGSDGTLISRLFMTRVRRARTGEWQQSNEGFVVVPRPYASVPDGDRVTN
jgi:hypothetical protein